jgi:hypothetical protein
VKFPPLRGTNVSTSSSRHAPYRCHGGRPRKSSIPVCQLLARRRHKPSGDRSVHGRKDRAYTLELWGPDGDKPSPMGFLSRLLIPRTVRRAAHPVRTAKRTVTPKSIKRARRALHPVSNAGYAITRSLNTKRRRRGRQPVYRHGTYSVRHRSAETAAKCKRTY